MTTGIDQLIEKYKKDPEFAEEFNKAKKRLDFAVLLTDFRQENGLTQRQMAEKVGKPQSTIARIENGSMNPSLQLMNDFAEAFDKKLEIKFV